MRTICPSCKKSVDIVSVEKSGNITTSVYSCGHRHIQILLEETISVDDSLRIKVKDHKGKVTLESKIKGQTEKRISRKPSKAIQIIFKDGKILHVHCKSADCGNEWKVKDKVPLGEKFSITQNQQGIWTITCKKCGREYFSG